MSVSPKDGEPERVLWAAVIAQAANDAMPKLTPTFVRKGDAGLDCKRARAWTGTSDFHLVCALAGLEGTWVLRKLRAGLSRYDAELARLRAEVRRGPVK